MAARDISLKRAYEKPARSDGRRILVERLWPRGVSKDAARIDLWVVEIAPSTELRRWYDHDPDKWPEFRRRYFAELREHDAALDSIRKEVKSGPVTFVYGSKETERNSAVVLREYLGKKR